MSQLLSRELVQAGLLLLLLSVIVISIKKDDAKAPHMKNFPSNKTASITMEEEEE
jgi:hypothetical protein